MTLTRKMLEELGIEKDNIETIIKGHSDSLEALKEERDKLQDSALKLPTVEAELSKLQNAENSYKEKYEAVEKDYEDYKAKIEAKETHDNKAAAYRKVLTDSGIDPNRIDTVLKVSNIDALEFGEDGNLKDVEKLTEAAKSEWSDFIVQTKKNKAGVQTPPANNGKEDELMQKFRQAVGLDTDNA